MCEELSSPATSPFRSLSPLTDLDKPSVSFGPTTVFPGSGASLGDPVDVTEGPLLADENSHYYAPLHITAERAAEIRAGEPLNTNDMDIFSSKMRKVFPSVAGLRDIVTESSSSSSSSSSGGSSISSSSKYMTTNHCPRLVQIIFVGTDVVVSQWRSVQCVKLLFVCI